MTRLRRAFSIDLRSLALFRVALAVTLLGDLAVRAGDIEAWYTDFGVLPVVALGREARWSLHALGGSLGYEALLFAIAAIAAIALLLGFFSRIALVVCWILTLSLLARNPDVQGGSATAYRAVLFWSLALPLGARWSIDRLRAAPVDGSNPDARSDVELFSLASVAIVLQVFLIYPLTVYGKLKTPCCWRNLEALHQVLNDDRVATWVSLLLRRVPWAHRAMTAGVLLLESVPPIFALAGGPRVRTAASFVMIALHAVLIPSVVRLGFSFPAIMATLWTLYLPSWFWDEAVPRLARTAPAVRERAAAIGRTVAGWLARIPREKKRRSARVDEVGRVATTIFVGAGLVLLLGTSGVQAFAKRRLKLPRAVSDFAHEIGLRQTWALYAGTTKSHQYVFAATLSDGTRVDLRRGGAPIEWRRDAEQAKNPHWTKYESGIISRKDLAALYTDYLARRWNRDHPRNRVEEIELVGKTRLGHRPWHFSLLWQRDFDPRVEPKSPGASKPRRRPGARVRLDVDARTINERRSDIADQEGGDEDDDDDADRLLPFTTADGAQILARASELVEARRRGRASATCALVDRSAVDSPKVKFADDSPWLETRGAWTIGTLSRCKRREK
jgi:hypothetical protein